METIICADKKVAEIWVPHGTDETIVQDQYRKYKQDGLYVVIFRSGNKNLIELTQELLRINL